MKTFLTDVRLHSRRQLEFKNHYPLTSGRRARYRMDAWLYTPAPLGVNSRDYGARSFFGDVKCMTRFSSISIPLRRLVDPDCDISPLTRIRAAMESAAQPGEIKSKRILYELRSLTHIFSSGTEKTDRIIDEALQSGQLTTVSETIKDNLKDIKDFLEKWRALYSQFLQPIVEIRLRQAYTWTDESISFITGHVLAKFHGRISNPADAGLLNRLRKMMDAELAHRQAMGFHCAGPEMEAPEVEQRIYRESVLKKWGQSVLYLTQEESSVRRRFGHVLAGVAAAAAMAFAVAASRIAERFFPGNGLSWSLAIIAAYIFKDRIKESLRGLFHQTLPGLTTDERVRLVDQATGRQVGTSSTRVRFLHPGIVPQAPAHLRATGGNPFRNILPPENVLHFRRDIVIRSNRLRESHRRVDTLTDIIRLKIDRILSGMDDPKKLLSDIAAEVPMEFKGKKLYHANLIVALSRRGKATSPCRRYRLVMTRSGLERIETVEGS